MAGMAFQKAHSLYGNTNAKILYVVGENEWNMYD